MVWGEVAGVSECGVGIYVGASLLAESGELPVLPSIASNPNIWMRKSIGQGRQRSNFASWAVALYGLAPTILRHQASSHELV